jgi:hypothetical protein
MEFKEIIEFIINFKKKHPQEIEDVFLNGYCYWFAKILEIRFGGEILYNPKQVHFATLINNQLFDISGYVVFSEDDVWLNWDEYQMNNDDVSDIFNNCILKT